MTVNLEQIKERFGIIGNDSQLNQAITIAKQVAPTELSVLIIGESGTGKEFIAQIIHAYSVRKHNAYFAINCGAIPEGTIDSELFGHEKGSFTGAMNDRKGYFEVANNGTIFLDEIGEMPKHTQVKLLRVLENGEMIKVGSSQLTKTNVRIIAASNINFDKAIKEGKFREDLYYRLNTIPIFLPPLRKRKGDIKFLFKRFASDFAIKYKMPPVRLTDDAVSILESYRWPGNIRQLKNIAEQISSIEIERTITAGTVSKYIPDDTGLYLPAPVENISFANSADSAIPDKEILYKIVVDLKKEINQLKSVVHEMGLDRTEFNPKIIDGDEIQMIKTHEIEPFVKKDFEEYHEITAEPVSHKLSDVELDLIKSTLERFNSNKRKTAKELGISERTLYRKIKEFNLE